MYVGHQNNLGKKMGNTACLTLCTPRKNRYLQSPLIITMITNALAGWITPKSQTGATALWIQLSYHNDSYISNIFEG